MNSSTCRAVRIAAGALTALLTFLSAGGPCRAETVTLQQGLDGYRGCASKTLWSAQAKKPAKVSAEHLYVRGTGNHVLIKFELPAGMGGKKLARARLEVFVPEVKNLRMINEVLCREVRQSWTAEADWDSAGAAAKWHTPGGTMDTETDFDNGRPKGAVDSYSFWEFNGQWFPHKYDFLQCPKGGKWIDFNVTPLVAKWTKDPASNHGVALQPVTQRDRRFPNQMVADIPSPASPARARRPRLVLDFEPLAEPYLLGMTHTLRKYCDKSTRHRFFGPFKADYEMAMARNEFEGFQVLVYPMSEPLKGVTFRWTDLVDPATGASIPGKDLCCNVQELVQLHPNGKINDWYFHGKNFEMPDPLSHARPIDLPRHVSTPLWFTVRTRPQTRPGSYHGKITVRPTNAPPRVLDLVVKVWDYQVPARWNFQTMGQMIWDNVRKAHGRITPELKRRYIDFLMDHRFMPTQQYARVLSPDLEDIPYCIARGGNTIYLSGNYTGNVAALKQRYDAVIELDKKLRAAGELDTAERLVDMSLVYIGDETSKWDLMRARSREIRNACPELMIMIGGSFPRKELQGVIDIYDPQIGGQSKTFSLREDMTHLIAASQARGERFFWYDAAGPMLPYPNVQCEEPLIASRVVFWMTWKYGVTGFEYYCYNIWSHNLPGADGRRWPERAFSSWGWGNTNGDGMLFYPGPEGPFSSVRFENIRDGIEDWESHYVLRDYVDALRKKNARSSAARELLAKAEALLKVPDEVVKDLKTWTWEPEVLLAARGDLGVTIEQFTKLVSEEEMLAARKARKESEVKRQRQMLKRRAAEAGKAAAQRAEEENRQ